MNNAQDIPEGFTLTHDSEWRSVYTGPTVNGDFEHTDKKGRRIGWTSTPEYVVYKEVKGADHFCPCYQVTRDGKPFGARWDKGFRTIGQMNRELSRRVAKSYERYQKVSV